LETFMAMQLDEKATEQLTRIADTLAAMWDHMQSQDADRNQASVEREQSDKKKMREMDEVMFEAVSIPRDARF